MKTVLIAATLFTAMASPVLADKMEISPNGTRKTALGPQANFTGTVMVDSYFGANEHLPQTGALVTFLPIGVSSRWKNSSMLPAAMRHASSAGTPAKSFSANGRVLGQSHSMCGKSVANIIRSTPT